MIRSLAALTLLPLLGVPAGEPADLVYESEPNDALMDADVLGALPGPLLHGLGRLHSDADADTWQVTLARPAVVQVTLATAGSTLMPLTSTGEVQHSRHFAPMLEVYDGRGAAAHVGSSGAAVLVMLEVELRAGTAWVRVRSGGGSGEYLLTVKGAP